MEDKNILHTFAASNKKTNNNIMKKETYKVIYYLKDGKENVALETPDKEKANELARQLTQEAVKYWDGMAVLIKIKKQVTIIKTEEEIIMYNAMGF